MERIVAGSGLRRPESCEAADGQLAVLLLGRRCVLGGRPGLPQCRSARTESGVSNRCGRQRAVDDGRAGHMEHTVAGLVSWEAVDGRRAGLLFGRRGCLADGQCSLSARVELRVSSTYGRRRAVDDGRAGHMEHTVAGPWSWKAVDGQRASAYRIMMSLSCNSSGVENSISLVYTLYVWGTTKYIHCINLQILK